MTTKGRVNKEAEVGGPGPIGLFQGGGDAPCGSPVILTDTFACVGLSHWNQIRPREAKKLADRPLDLDGNRAAAATIRGFPKGRNRYAVNQGPDGIPCPGGVRAFSGRCARIAENFVFNRSITLR